MTQAQALENGSEKFYEGLELFSKQQCPSLTKAGLSFPRSFASPFVVEMKQSDFDTCQHAIAAFTQLRNKASYQDWIKSQSPQLGTGLPNAFSLFQAFDFHLSPDGPKLIEINTNAGFGLGLFYLNEY